MLRKNSQSGFVIPSIMILIGVLLTVGAAMVIYKNKTLDKPGSQTTQVANPSANLKQSPNPTPKESKAASTSFPVKTTRSTPTPKPSAIPVPTSGSVSNPYDLNSPTGSVKVMVKAQSGELAYTPLAELTTLSGFKVLDGRSTDKITQYGKDRTDYLRGEIIFSTAPPGPYKVRISYNGQWSDQKDISVSSAQQTTIEFAVTGQAATPAPTPTPTPKSTCQVNIVSKSSETAPATVNLAAGAPYIYKPANLADKYITAVKWDYNGDGTWDTDMSSSLQGIISKEYTSAGNYTVKAQVQLSDGEITDTCSNSFNLN